MKIIHTYKKNTIWRSCIIVWYSINMSCKQINGAEKSPEDAGSWYCLFKNLEASLSFLWHKTRIKVWASSKPILSWLCELRLSESNPDEICSLAVISIWMTVPVCRKKSHYDVSFNHSIVGIKFSITSDKTWRVYRLSICSAKFASCSTKERGRPSPSAIKNS